MNDVRVRVLRELLGHFEEEDEGFKWRLVTGDEAWVHQYDPENRRQYMEYRHKQSLEPKKFKTKASRGNVILTVLWNSDGVAFTNFL
jgi:hypothetical protein